MFLNNNKGVMRTFEAIIAAVIMILGISFILSDYGTSFSPNPSWEVINARNFAEDVLIILEKGEIDNQSELGYYITNNNKAALQTKLQSLIPNSYVYKFNISEIGNVVYIHTPGEGSIDTSNSGYLTNGYRIEGLSNKNNIWKFHETQTGWPGEYTVFFPDGGSVVIYGLLVVDLLDEIPGYDSVYLKLERGNPSNPLDFSTSTTKLSSKIPLRIGDLVTFEHYTNNIKYEYNYQISNIARDGNSISLALIDETISIGVVGANNKTAEIFNETFRFTLYDGVYVDTMDVEKKIGEPDQYTIFTRELKQGSWTTFGNYSGNIKSLSFDGVNGHIVINIVPYKENSIYIEKPGEMETTISAKRIISIMEGNNVRAFYVSLVMGRRKL
ncbi:MAG: hypothetical protein GYA51_13745 [Candidatus Methanofastidiosa archaeon]|nr:hypothetical protein [Candidatus Methanofastidiosa archaeon]